MTVATHSLYISLIAVPLLGLCAQWTAWRFHLPAIVLLSATGLLLGPVFQLIQPDIHAHEILRAFIKFSVAIILFEGGLYLHLYELKEVFAGVRRLIFPAIPIAWIIYSVFSYFLGGLSISIALIFGAIIVVSGPTVVIPLLRQARLKRNSASYIKWEGIINDPIGALLAVVVFQFCLSSHLGNLDFRLVWNLLGGVVIAILLGLSAGFGLGSLFKRGLVAEYLKPPIVIITVLLIYYLSNILQEEAGLFAVTIFGITLSNLKLPSVSEIRRFTESIVIILISCLFIILTSSLNIKQLALLNGQSAVLLLSIIFIARPIIVLISTLGSKMKWPDRILLSWIAPRGVVAAAVAGVFAFELSHAGLQDADILVPLVFALILSTVVMHGFSLSFVAKKLGLAAAKNNGVLIVGASPWSVGLAKILMSQNIPIIVADTSWHKLKYARLAGLPVYYGQVLSEEAEERMELSEIGYVLAVSDNDAYNALVCARFAHEFGRNHVYQLPIFHAQTKDARDLATALAGTQLFGDDETYETLLKYHFLDWEFYIKSFNENHTYEAFIEKGPIYYISIAIIHADQTISFCTKQKPKVRADEKLLIYHKKQDNT